MSALLTNRPFLFFFGEDGFFNYLSLAAAFANCRLLMFAELRGILNPLVLIAFGR